MTQGAASQELYQRLLAQPTIAVPLVAETVSRLLVSGPCLYYHHNLLEPNGVATVFDLLDGTDAKGGLIAGFSLGANGTRPLAVVTEPTLIVAGLFLAMTSGTISGCVYVKTFGHENDVDLYRALSRRPTIPIPIPTSSASQVLVSGPCLFVGFEILETAGAVAQVRFRDGLSAGGTEVGARRLNANGSGNTHAAFESPLCSRGLFLDFNSGQIKGAALVKVLDANPDDSAYAELVDSPVVAIPVANLAGSRVLASGPVILCAIFTNAQTVVTTTGDFMDGGDANGVSILPVRLGAGAPLNVAWGADGVYCPRGLFLNLTVGSLEGSVWVKVRGREQERELYRLLKVQPPICLPLNTEAASRLLASGPLLLGGYCMTTGGVNTGWRFKDGTDDNGVVATTRLLQTGNSTTNNGTFDAPLLMRGGLFLSMVSGTLKGGVYVKMLGWETRKALFDLLEAQPAQDIFLDGASVSQVLVSGPCLICDCHLMVSGGVNLIYDLLDGLDANGQEFWTQNGGLSGAVDVPGFRYAAMALNGLFLKFTSGVMRGSFRVKVLDPTDVVA